MKTLARILLHAQRATPEGHGPRGAPGGDGASAFEELLGTLRGAQASGTRAHAHAGVARTAGLLDGHPAASPQGAAAPAPADCSAHPDAEEAAVSSPVVRTATALEHERLHGAREAVTARKQRTHARDEHAAELPAVPKRPAEPRTTAPDLVPAAPAAAARAAHPTRSARAGDAEDFLASAVEPLDASSAEPLDASPAELIDASPSELVDASPAELLEVSPAEPLAAGPAAPLGASPTGPIGPVPPHGRTAPPRSPGRWTGAAEPRSTHPAPAAGQTARAPREDQAAPAATLPAPGPDRAQVFSPGDRIPAEPVAGDPDRPRLQSAERPAPRERVRRASDLAPSADPLPTGGANPVASAIAGAESGARQAAIPGPVRDRAAGAEPSEHPVARTRQPRAPRRPEMTGGARGEARDGEDLAARRAGHAQAAAALEPRPPTADRTPSAAFPAAPTSATTPEPAASGERRRAEAKDAKLGSNEPARRAAATVAADAPERAAAIPGTSTSLPPLAGAEPAAEPARARPPAPAPIALLPVEPGEVLSGAVTPTTAHLHLSSDTLGDVALHLRIQDGAAHVRVEGGSRATVEARAPELARALAAEGLGLARLEHEPRSTHSQTGGSGSSPGDPGDRHGSAEGRGSGDGQDRGSAPQPPAPARNAPGRTAQNPRRHGGAHDVTA